MSEIAGVKLCESAGEKSLESCAFKLSGTFRGIFGIFRTELSLDGGNSALVIGF